MGFLRRKDRDDRAGAEVTPPAPKPIDPGEVDLNVARAVVHELCSAINSSDSHMRAAIAYLRRASGMPDLNDHSAVFSAYKEDPTGFSTRAFRWLSVAAAKANAEGQHDIAVMAYAWTFHRTTSVEPHAVGADLIAVGLDRAPDDAVEAMIAHGEAALSCLRPDQILATTGTPEELTPAMVSKALQAHKSARAHRPTED